MMNSPFSRLASATVSGLVSIAAQTFAGVKTFTSAIVASAGLELGAALSVASGSMTFKSGATTIGTLSNLGQLTVVEVTASGVTNGYVLGGARVLLNDAANTLHLAAPGLSAALAGPLGTGASDVAVKVGTTLADASVNAAAKLLSVRTGIGGTEVEYGYWTKNGGGNLFTNFITLPSDGSGLFRIGLQGLYGNNVSGNLFFNYNAASGSSAVIGLNCSTGRIDQSGTDSTATPGAATINKPIGKSSIAAGASSLVVTNSLATAAMHCIFSPHARDATCKELIAVCGAGTITFSGSAVATATIPLSWELKGIL